MNYLFHNYIEFYKNYILGNEFNYGLATNSTIGAAAAQTLGGLSKSPTPADVGLRESKSVEIPESIVGAILGKQTILP